MKVANFLCVINAKPEFRLFPFSSNEVSVIGHREMRLMIAEKVIQTALGGEIRIMIVYSRGYWAYHFNNMSGTGSSLKGAIDHLNYQLISAVRSI